VGGCTGAALQATNGDLERAADWIFSHMDDLAHEEAPPVAPAAAAAPAAPAAETLSDGPGRYRLVAFVTHLGSSTASGHYVAHVRKGGQWVLYNDTKVARSETPPSDLGYLYVYARADMPVL
jgi:ubiquitin carboxyl-terminal hydrolase 5/13